MWRLWNDLLITYNNCLFHTIIVSSENHDDLGLYSDILLLALSVRSLQASPLVSHLQSETTSDNFQLI